MQSYLPLPEGSGRHFSDLAVPDQQLAVAQQATVHRSGGGGGDGVVVAHGGYLGLMEQWVVSKLGPGAGPGSRQGLDGDLRLVEICHRVVRKSALGAGLGLRQGLDGDIRLVEICQLPIGRRVPAMSGTWLYLPWLHILWLYLP